MEDNFDKLLREKLQDFEADPTPDTWEAIATKLPVRHSLWNSRSSRHISAAAAIALLIISGVATWIIPKQTSIPQAMSKQHSVQTLDEAFNTPTLTAEKIEHTHSSVVEILHQPQTLMADQQQLCCASNSSSVVPLTPTLLSPQHQKISLKTTLKDKPKTLELKTNLIAEATPKQQPKSKKWNFGMGGGNIGSGTNGSTNTYALRNSQFMDDRLMLMNSVASPMQRDLPKTDIHHNKPISFGLAVSRQLNRHFSLQSGIVYSYMKSDWKTNGNYHAETKQQLHFIGIPLSLVYHIAEWKRLSFYTSAGGMGEVNVAGRVKSTLFSEDQKINSMTESTRMKELLWSVNARIGMSYPLIRFVNAFAETGVDYNFSNGSEIQTARSEKPCNLSFQVGFRFGF